jgi:3-oxoacyl-[acyl-carrier protein] reductase
VVVGGASGIGAAAARLLAGTCELVIADLDRSNGEAVAAECEGEFVAADVTDETSVVRLFERVAELPPLRALVVTAGILPAAMLADMERADWDRCVAVNLTGAFLLAKHAHAPLSAAAGAAAVFTSSTAGLAGSRGQAAYCATKAGIIGLVRALSDEWAADGIRVNAVCPGWVDTPFNDPVWEQVGGRVRGEPALLASVPMRRQATAEEIAPVIEFLCSEAASYVTGQAVVADGGLMAVR